MKIKKDGYMYEMIRTELTDVVGDEFGLKLNAKPYCTAKYLVETKAKFAKAAHVQCPIKFITGR